jgi:6-phosphofructokinase 1
VRLVEAGRFGRAAVFHPPGVDDVPLEQVAGTIRTIDLSSDTVATARDLGICLGD